MFAALPVAFANPGAGGGGGGGGGVTVSVAPVFQVDSGFASNFVFPSCTATVSGGSATAFAWSFRNISGGSWAVFGGQGTDTASAVVSNIGPGETVSAEFVCTATVGGVNYAGAATLEYNSLF